jgi:hypothetical protein
VAFQVYLPAIEQYVPNKILRCLRAFLEFCYIARHDVITEQSLAQLKDALRRFHYYRQAFDEIDVDPGSSFPRQHSLIHYADNIRLFGAPNGLCSSIMEAKHIKAVKEPWRRTNRDKPLIQILNINQRLNKLYAMQLDFTNRGMLEAAALRATLEAIGVFSTPPLSYKSHSENTPETMRVESEKPDGVANSQVISSYNNDDDHDDEYNDENEDEANVNEEVICKLVPSRVSLGKRAGESIYLTLRLHSLILTST